MMRIFFIILLFIAIFSFVYRGYNTKDLFVPITLNNYSSAKKDLSFLKKKLKDIDIVLLGEGLHFYETDGESKLNVIKFLHEEMGFDLLLMEYSFYDFYNLNNAIGKSIYFKDTVLRYSRYLPKHMLDVIEYVNKQKLKGRTIELGGLDTDMNYYGFARNPINFLILNDIKLKYDTEIQDFYYLLQTPYKDLEKLKVSNNNNIIKSIREKTKANLFFNNDSLNNYWLQIFNNLDVELYYDIQKAKLTNKKLNPKKGYENLVIEVDNSKKRDSMMFQNFEYLKNLYKGKKIIVYTSSFHIRKSVKPFQNKREIGNNTTPLGKYISDKYNKSYHIAWISNSVEAIKKKNNYFLKRNKSSLENFLYRNNYGSGFIDLNELGSNGDSVFTMYPIWKFKTKGNWSHAYNAIIYIDTLLLTKGYYNYGIYNDSIERNLFSY